MASTQRGNVFNVNHGKNKKFNDNFELSICTLPIWEKIALLSICKIREYFIWIAQIFICIKIMEIIQKHSSRNNIDLVVRSKDAQIVSQIMTSGLPETRKKIEVNHCKKKEDQWKFCLFDSAKYVALAYPTFYFSLHQSLKRVLKSGHYCNIFQMRCKLFENFKIMHTKRKWWICRRFEQWIPSSRRAVYIASQIRERWEHFLVATSGTP